MKIKAVEKSFDEVMALPKAAHPKPKKPNWFMRTLVRLLAVGDLKATHFQYDEVGMERLKKDEACLILMNHSSFIDLKIASRILYPRPYQIVCTSDGFVGKGGLMRAIGCIPTKKFVSDPRLVRDMAYSLKKENCSVLMYPEASYTFDGTATPLPESLGKCLKFLGVPVVMIRTAGAFARDPLYNGLKLRQVDVSATVTYLLSPEEIAALSAEELNQRLSAAFDFDNFRWQQENRVRVDEPFRADGLNRVLYKCPHCKTEGRMEGKGVRLTCNACGKQYTLTEYGLLQAADGEICHVPDWYRWEREEVRRELTEDTYLLDIPVTIGMLVDEKALYMVGEGRLRHTAEGFTLTGCGGKLTYTQPATVSYSLYADYYWYEIGDMICIGNNEALYYCFPKEPGDVVAKTRLATEELYKLKKAALV